MAWYDNNIDNSPWLKALRRATREGWRYQHVQRSSTGRDYGATAGAKHGADRCSDRLVYERRYVRIHVVLDL
jgi:hypothetical protein